MKQEVDALEDAEIVELYLRRDETAIERTAGKYGTRLRALAQSITGDPQTAEECENDAYLAAWRSIPPHKPRDYLYAFLARIVRHLSLDRCREQRRLKRSGLICALDNELEQCIPSPDDGACRLDDLALGEAVNGFLGTLSQEKRNVFLRRYWYADSIFAIARRYGFSQSKVKTMLFRTRNQFRDYLKQEGYDL